MSPGFPWENGAEHKELMSLFRWMAPFITVARDHGSGEVVLDDLGRPVVELGLRGRGRHAPGDQGAT